LCNKTSPTEPDVGFKFFQHETFARGCGITAIGAEQDEKLYFISSQIQSTDEMDSWRKLLLIAASHPTKWSERKRASLNVIVSETLSEVPTSRKSLFFTFHA
jgi:hypothetical protein